MVSKDLIGASCTYMDECWTIEGIAKNMLGTFFTIRKDKEKQVVKKEDVEIAENEK